MPAADRKKLARGNSGLSVSSVATTPPAQYTVPLSAQPSVTTPRETVIEIPISPKPKTVASQSPREGDGGVDAEKMQLGLQGIKSMRARSASSSVRRAGDPTASAGADSTGVPSSSNSRAGSACRSRRRILNNGSSPADCASPASNSPTHLLGVSQPAVFTTTAVDVLTPRRSARNNIVSPRGTSAAGAVLTCPSSPGSRLNNSNRSSSSSNNPPLSPQPAQGLPIAARIAQELSGVWYEAKLLLRQIPHSDNDWKKMQQIINEAPQFFKTLATLSSQTKFPKGAILRHILPFDENTSSNDQAKGRVVSDNNSLDNVAVPAALVGHESVLEGLAESAVRLRGVIRVKMADEADVSQASTAAAMLCKFLARVDVAVGTTGLSTMTIVDQLEAFN